MVGVGVVGVFGILEPLALLACVQLLVLLVSSESLVVGSVNRCGVQSEAQLHVVVL
jgi:hypothetical protein